MVKRSGLGFPGEERFAHLRFDRLRGRRYPLPVPRSGVSQVEDLWLGLASSVAIEGHYRLPREPGRLELAAGSPSGVDESALAGSAEAWFRVMGSGSGEVSADLLRSVNRCVREGVGGGWRTQNVTVGTYKCPPFALVPHLMARFVRWVNEELPADGPERAFLVHLYLAWIHPWVDGNGRSARVMEAYLLAKAGYRYPWAATRTNWWLRSGYYKSLGSGLVKERFVTHQRRAVKAASPNPEFVPYTYDHLLQMMERPYTGWRLSQLSGVGSRSAARDILLRDV